MREFDEAHVQRLLMKALAENEGNYNATDRALGLSIGTVYHILKEGQPCTDKAANAVGYRKKIPGRLCGARRPLKFVRLDDMPSTTGERK